MIAKLERTHSTTLRNKDPTQKTRTEWEQQQTKNQQQQQQQNHCLKTDNRQTECSSISRILY